MYQFGFEISLDDIKNCFEDLYDGMITDEYASEIMDAIDLEYCSEQALMGDDLDIQTEFAYEAIKKEIEEKKMRGEF